MTTTYTDIEEKQETLAQLSGAKDYSADDVKNWRDWARSAKQGNAGGGHEMEVHAKEPHRTSGRKEKGSDREPAVQARDEACGPVGSFIFI
jgi:hypothetical protein